MARDMRVILHLADVRDGLLAVRAAEAIWQEKTRPGTTTLIEYENGHRFQVNRNKQSISVWRIPDVTV